MTCTAPDATVYDLEARRAPRGSATQIARALLADEPLLEVMLMAERDEDFATLRRRYALLLDSLADSLVEEVPEAAGFERWVLLDFLLDSVLPTPRIDEMDVQ